MVRDQSGRPASTTLTPSVVKSVKTPADRTDHGTVKNLTLTKEPILEVNDAQYKVASVKVNDNDNTIPSMYQPILMSDSVRREITTIPDTANPAPSSGTGATTATDYTVLRTVDNFACAAVCVRLLHLLWIPH